MDSMCRVTLSAYYCFNKSGRFIYISITFPFLYCDRTYDAVMQNASIYYRHPAMIKLSLAYTTHRKLVDMDIVHSECPFHIV